MQLALEQLPAPDLDREILARTDIGGRTHAFTQDCRDAGIRFSVGYEVDQRVRGVIMALPEAAWQSAIDGDGAEREGAQVSELTDRVELSSWPAGTRLIVRRERPHPGAQLSVFDCETGYRHTAFITDQADEDIAAMELRHRRRAKVEDAIRVVKETGMRRMPFAAFEHNAAWLEISLAAQALLRWAALLCLESELALADPKRVRQRLLHVAGPGALGPAGDVASAARLAVGRGVGGGLRAAAGAGGRLESVVQTRPPATTLLVAPGDPGLPANGRRRCDSPARGPREERRTLFVAAHPQASSQPCLLLDFEVGRDE